MAGRRIKWSHWSIISALVMLGNAAAVQAQETFYVHCDTGDDSRNFITAQDPSTPWLTLNHANSDPQVGTGDTVVALGGTCNEQLQPGTNGVTWKADPLFGTTITTAGTLVSVNGKTDVVVEGFRITGGGFGMRFQNADRSIARNNEVFNNTNTGIAIESTDDGRAEGNRTYSNGAYGVRVILGNRVQVINNLSYDNDDWGISLETVGGTDTENQVQTNTVDANKNGIKIQNGVSTITNNIVTNNTKGIPNSIGIQGTNVLNSFNLVIGHVDDFNITPIPSSGDTLSADPLYLDRDGADNMLGGVNGADDRFHLSNTLAGQLVDSPALNKGNPAVTVTGGTSPGPLLDGAFGDQNDMGYHYPVSALSNMNMFGLSETIYTFANGTATYDIMGYFELGTTSDGINPLTELTEVGIDSSTILIPVGGCVMPGGASSYQCSASAGGVDISLTIKSDDTFTIFAENVPANPLPPPGIVVSLTVGNDSGTNPLAEYTGGELQMSDPSAPNSSAGGDNLITGTAGPDNLVGTDLDDTIQGLGHHDTMKGGLGNDLIDGGTGNDNIMGEDGNDALMGNEGHDIIDGGNGDDTLVGESGNDNLKGQAGDDDLSGGEGHDMLTGHDGADTLSGGPGNDNLDGGGGVDTCDGGPGTDVCIACETNIGCELIK